MNSGNDNGGNGSPAATLGVILAGGGSVRMGGEDKATALLDDKRLIDHVLARLSPQVGAVVISGAHDYGHGIPAIADREEGAEGPVAGIAAVAEWASAHMPHIDALLCAPVDCPLQPRDLFEKLTSCGGSTIAQGDGRLQPAFGYWRMQDISANATLLNNSGWLSLQRLAEACNAKTVQFGDSGAFANINRPEDLAGLQKSNAGTASV